KDPSRPVYATNLLSAQSLAGKLDDADRTIAAYAPAHPAWFGWRLLVDPELKSVAGRPGARALVAAKAGALRFGKLGDDIAVSRLGLIAVREWSSFGGPGAPSDHQLAVYDPIHAGANLRLDAARDSDRVLGGLGFERRKTAWVDALDSPDHVVSPDKSTTI